MRNVVDINNTYTVTIDGTIPPSHSSNSYVYGAKSTRRSDAVSTVRRNGHYTDPTNYLGRFYYTGSSVFACTGITTFGSYIHTVWGTSAPDYYSSSLGKSYGTTLQGGPSFPQKAYSMLDSNLRRKVLDQDWNLGQTLAEAPQALRFISDSLLLSYGLLKAVKRGDLRLWREVLKDLGRSRKDFGLRHSPSVYRLLRDDMAKFGMENMVRSGRAVETLQRAHINGVQLSYYRHPSRARKLLAKGLASGWLSYQFALLPLMNDIYQACALIVDGLKSPDAVFVRSTVTVDPLGDPLPNNSANLAGRRNGWSEKRELKGELSFGITNSSLFELTRLGLTNPMNIAWNLLPLSFVVDWFVTVGTFLSCLSQPMGVTFFKGYKTAYQKWVINKTFIPTGYKSATGNLPVCSARSTSFERSLYYAFPIPAPYFRGLGNMSGGKIISAIALLVQRT